MRGSGKTHIGSLAATALNRPFIDADEYFAESVGQSIAQFVGANGWPAFRAKETELLQEMMEKSVTGHVISLGGGIVESEGARRLLTEYCCKDGLVVHIAREIDEINIYLEEIGVLTPSRPALGEPIQDIFARRQPWFVECSNYEYLNYTGLAGQTNLAASKGSTQEVIRFFRFISGVDLNKPTLSRSLPTAFLSLTQPDLGPVLNVIDDLTIGADAVELRVDLLSPTGISPKSPAVPPEAFVALQLAGLRHHTGLPIVFTIRTKAQGGYFPDDSAEAYERLLALGRRAACEYLDIEVDMPDSVLSNAADRRGNSTLIGSWHDWSGEFAWNSQKVTQKFAACAAVGDVIKLVGTARAPSDNTALAQFVERMADKTDKPILAINMGQAGQVTRVLNPILTPITHPALPTAAAPGQMSAVQINQARHLLGILPAKQFYLFGTPISASLSPIIHNTGFTLLGLPHLYSLHETEQVDDSIEAVMRLPNFGGASVTIPHKLSIMSHLNDVSEDARIIGAVNTVIPVEGPAGRTLYGDNSDWRAILLLARSGLPNKFVIDEATTGLVIGAGGTCRAAIYALHKLGLSTIYLYNRTSANAETVKGAFPSIYNIICVDGLQSFPGQPPTVIVSTVPGSSLNMESKGEGLLITPELLSSPYGGVAIDMAYRPNITALLQLVKEHEGKPWTAVSGVEILLEQAFVQFERWTGKRAPKGGMQKAAWAKYNS